MVDNDANLAAVNNEGEVPLDLAEEEEMEDFLSEEIDKQGNLCYCDTVAGWVKVSGW